MNKFLQLILAIGIASCISHKGIAQKSNDMIPFEKDNNNSATYSEAIAYYKVLDKSPLIQMNEVGNTDSGHPLHEVIVTNDGVFDRESIQTNGKVTLLINNGIHPGEPCGVDASMIFARDLINNKSNLLEHATVVIIPLYNIGGSLNRGSSSRANQNGPAAYGFRGNAKNLDLNRDFIKCDSKNARAFATIYNKWTPQVFVDNHTSNGADYQYVMTLIATQKDKMHPALAEFMTETMLPELYSSMENKEYEMVPYVYSMKDIPDKGIMGFMDLGRYSSGYAAMHHAISFMPETHMLKDYRGRVESTYAFMESMLEHISKHHKTIIENQERAFAESKIEENWVLAYELDKEQSDSIPFKGYEAKYKPSGIHGEDRLYYDQNEPYEKQIKLYNTYKPVFSIEKPASYIIPQAYSDVVSLLKLNGVEINRLENDVVKSVEVYYIEDYSSTARPYEGHYLHHSVELRTERQDIQYFKGDYIVNTDQSEARYIIETLEPQAPDSYFAWNFFDGILMQKEHYSTYVWEDLAMEILEKDEALRATFEQKKKENEAFAGSSREQLDYIYRHSSYYEPTFMRYPIGRILKNM